MNLNGYAPAFLEAIVDTDRDRAREVIAAALEAGVTPEEVVFEIVIPVIEQRDKRLVDPAEMTLAQHFMTAQIATEVTEEMVPRFRTPPELLGRVVIGTAQGDLHTLGKRIIMGCLRASMMECVDLGVNVPPERFVDEAVAHDADVIGISAMMVHTARGENGCIRVRQLLKERDLDQRIKIIVGGAPYRFDPDLYKLVGADAWAEDGVSAARVVGELVAEVRR